MTGADLPPDDATAGDLWVSLDSQTQRLVDANASKARVLAIFAACDAQQARVKAILEPKRPWWRPF